MTTPITATATRPEPPPEGVRPVLWLVINNGVCGWYAHVYTDSRSPNVEVGSKPSELMAEARIVRVPTDAEADAHARYVAALEAEVKAWAECERQTHGDYSDEDWKDAQRRLSECRKSTAQARAEWEAERGKA